MGSLTAGSYGYCNPYEFLGDRAKIFTLDPLEPERTIPQEPNPPPPVGLLGLLALGLGSWAMRRSLAPDAPANSGATTPSAAEGSDKGNLGNQRRVSNLTDEINGGVGQAPQSGPETLNRAAQLAGLPYGGFTLGQRTPFPPAGAGTDTANLPAVLRGANMNHSDAAVTGQARTNKGAVGWQNFDLLRPPFDFPEIPDFLRRAPVNKDNSIARPEKYPLGDTGSGGGGVGGGDNGGGGGSGGNDDDCNEEIRQVRKICIDAYANGWKGDYSGWKSDYRVGPYKTESGRPWTIQDCMKGFLRKECGGEDPNDPENQKKYAWPPRPRGSRSRRGGQ
jgi:hypothetical protein